MTEMFGEAWSPMSVPDLAPDDDDERSRLVHFLVQYILQAFSKFSDDFPVAHLTY